MVFKKKRGCIFPPQSSISLYLLGKCHRHIFYGLSICLSKRHSPQGSSFFTFVSSPGGTAFSSFGGRDRHTDIATLVAIHRHPPDFFWELLSILGGLTDFFTSFHMSARQDKT
jgi:hypothetical protein